MTAELASYINGWRGYFAFCQTPSVLRRLEEWTTTTRSGRNLAAMENQEAALPQTRGRRNKTHHRDQDREDQAGAHGASAEARRSTSHSIITPSPNSASLPFLNQPSTLNPPNRRIRTRTCGGVGGGGREPPPIPMGRPSAPRIARSLSVDFGSGNLIAQSAPSSLQDDGAGRERGRGGG